jgi:hypothetical protein
MEYNYALYFVKCVIRSEAPILVRFVSEDSSKSLVDKFLNAFSIIEIIHDLVQPHLKLLK